MTSAAPRPDWIAVDWGTTRLRAWAVGAAGDVLGHAESDDGMGKLDKDAFEPALLRLAGNWLGEGAVEGAVDVVACGMVGSRQGWAEAPYCATPCPACPPGAVAAPARDPRISVRILPGVKQASPADVMRGEETQIAGYLAECPEFDGVVCLPGTHSKWVRVKAGRIAGFRTAMTGEMFESLRRHSVLRHAVAESGWDRSAFEDALSDSLAHPEQLATALFSLRAESLLQGLSGNAARARLSGLLVGIELAGVRDLWPGQPVALIGAPALTSIYRDALSAQGIAPAVADGAAMTRAGLAAARALLDKAA